MFSESGRPLRGKPSSIPYSVRVGFALADRRPMATVQTNASVERSARTFDDPDHLLSFAEDLTRAAKWIIDHDPRLRRRAPSGVSSGHRAAGR